MVTKLSIKERKTFGIPLLIPEELQQITKLFYKVVCYLECGVPTLRWHLRRAWTIHGCQRVSTRGLEEID